MNLFDNVCTYLYIVNLSKDIVMGWSYMVDFIIEKASLEKRGDPCAI